MKKHRNVKRLTISRETLRDLAPKAAMEVAGAATETCFQTCPVSCMVSCLDYITCRCPDTNVDCGPTQAPYC